MRKDETQLHLCYFDEAWLMLDYPALVALAAIHRTGSLDRAAVALGVTPSAVSQRLRGLEDRHGAVLIVRGTPARATDEGLRLIRHLQAVELLERDLGHRTAAPLRIAINADSLATWAIPALAACPGLVFDVVIDDQDHAQALLRSGEVVGAIVSLPDPPPGCDSLRLGALTYVATAAPAFAARHFPDGVTAQAVAAAPGLIFSNKDDLQRRWIRQICGRPVDYIEHCIGSTQGFVDACLAGMAWALNPRPLVAGHLAVGRLVDLSPGHPLAVPLFWQRARALEGALGPLTAAIRAAARALD
jgi:LysR family transcriptional regulator, chromosome initiation inhibitor